MLSVNHRPACITYALQCRIYGHNPRIVDDILADAERCWKEAKSEQVTIYSSTTMNQWHQVASRPKRPLDSIILDRGVKEDLLADARTFLGSRPWYSDRGIPFRRGYLLVRSPQPPAIPLFANRLPSMGYQGPGRRHSYTVSRESWALTCT